MCIFGKSKQNALSLWFCVLYLGPICYWNKTCVLITSHGHADNKERYGTFMHWHISYREVMGCFLRTVSIFSVSRSKLYNISQTVLKQNEKHGSDAMQCHVSYFLKFISNLFNITLEIQLYIDWYITHCTL